MSEGVEGGEEKKNRLPVRAGGFFFPLPLHPSQFLSPSHWLGKLFTSPQPSTVFLIQDGGLNDRWEYPLAPAKIRLHCRLSASTQICSLVPRVLASFRTGIRILFIILLCMVDNDQHEEQRRREL